MTYLRAALLVVLFIPCVHSATAEDLKRCRDLLRTALGEHGPETRRQAVLALSLLGGRQPYITMVQSALADKDLPVRLAAVSSLAEVRSKTSISALKQALDDDTPEVSFAAAKALLALNDPAGKGALLSVLSGETKTSSSFFSKQKRDAMRMMQTPKGMFLFALRQGIGFAPIPGIGSGLASMEGILSDPGVSGRATAALLLAREKDPKTLAALRDALSDKDGSVRASAVHAIALRDDPKLTRDLTPLLDDKKEAVRLRAAAAVLRLELIRTANPVRSRSSVREAQSLPRTQ
jgi:HEAT repeat protein